MKLRDAGFTVCCVVVCVCTLYYVLNLCIPSIPDDSVFEEYLEDELEDQTGLSVDLTPCTPESP